MADKEWSLLLRYSNAERDTIREHEKIAAVQGYVCWGWWKKDFEPFGREPLERLKAACRRGIQTVGLVNRKDGFSNDGLDVYVAKCESVAFRDDGARISTPDKAATPDYYSNEEFPAWFRFVGFEQVTEAQFVRLFGSVPSLDATMYEAVRSESEEGHVDWDMLPRHSWSMKPVATTGDSILHLSDLHFGSMHAFAVSDSDSMDGPGKATLLSKISQVLEANPSISIGLVIVTGDVVSRSEENAYPDARQFLVKLCGYLGLDREHVVLMPGNHDINLLQDETITRDYRHERPFRNFLASFYGEEEVHELERVQRFASRDGWDVSVVALNSSRLRGQQTREYGYVGSHRYLPLLKYVTDTLRQLDDKASRPPLLIAALHHHLVPVDEVVNQEHDRPVSVTLDAGEIISHFQDSGLQLVLHGHRHVPFISYVRRSRVVSVRQVDWPGPEGGIAVIGMGTTGSGMYSPRWEVNVAGIYTPTDSGLRVEIVGFGPLTSNLEPIASAVLPLPALHY